MRCVLLVLILGVHVPLSYGAEDISSVKSDLILPSLVKGEPSAGKRVKQTHPEWKDTEVYHVL